MSYTYNYPRPTVTADCIVITRAVISTNNLSQLCMYIPDTLHVVFGKLR